MGPDAIILVFWMLSAKPAFSLSSLPFIKKLFSSSLLSSVKVVSSAYLKLLIFLLEILIPACDSSSLAFHMIYSAYKLMKQGDSIQPWHTPFPILRQSIFLCLEQCNYCNYCFLPCIQVSLEAGKVIWYSHLFQNFPQFIVIHAFKGFDIVNEADVFLGFSWFFCDPAVVGNLISGFSAFSKSSLYLWKFSVHI